MKRRLIFTAIIVMVTVWVLPANVTAQESGQCYFQANEAIYLKIYNLDKNGVKRPFGQPGGDQPAGRPQKPVDRH